MKDYIEQNLSKMLGSAGFIGLLQFIGQIRDYFSNGTLDTHEFEQLILSATSGAQSAILIAVMIYVKFFMSQDKK